MRLKKHTDFMMVLVGLIILNYYLYDFGLSDGLEFIAGAVIAISFITVVFVWLIFIFARKKKKIESDKQEIK